MKAISSENVFLFCSQEGACPGHHRGHEELQGLPGHQTGQGIQAPAWCQVLVRFELFFFYPKEGVLLEAIEGTINLTISTNASKYSVELSKEEVYFVGFSNVTTLNSHFAPSFEYYALSFKCTDLGKMIYGSSDLRKNIL